MPRILIAGGGTAGHVVPALAVADELRARGAEVSFVGARGRAEAELVPAAGYEISYLSVTGLDRSHPLRAARAAAASARAVVTSARLLGRQRPDAVLGAGGYASGPVGMAAVLRRTPLVLTEADSRLGLANRLLAPFARRVCLSFPIPGHEGRRYLVTGRPLARAVTETERGPARSRLGIAPDASCLLVFGGSLGARSINTCALEAFARPGSADGDRAPPVVVHVAGQRDYPELRARLDELGRPDHYRLYEYLESLADPLAACDLVLARAGGSVLELAAAGRPALLVPYPHAAGAHQAANAAHMADAGAAVVLPDDQLEAGRLAGAVGELLRDSERLDAMGRAGRALARPDAAVRVADELLAAVAAGGEPKHDAGPGEPEVPWRGRRLHFVGVGGAGMSGLALVARRLGADVSGCDRAESPYTRMLREAGVEPEIGHSVDHLTAGTELVVSTAVPDDVPELATARERGTPVIRRGAVLAEVASLRRLLAVAGTHGKTTTAAMAAHCMAACGLEPAYLVGAELRGDDSALADNAAWGTGGWLVAETDESDRSFLELSPEVAVITSMELDHHTTYGSLVEIERAFASFLERVSDGGAVVAWRQTAARRLLGEGRRLVLYDIERPGTGEEPDIAARDVRQEELGMRFELVRAGVGVCEVSLPVAGRHNVLNALAALAGCELAGCDLERAARSLASFRAAGRRFERKGEVGGVRVFDDYAHHPTEVRATLETARALEPDRLIAVFQPHLYSRTLRLQREFGSALALADAVVVVDVYPARERAEGEFEGVTGKLVADACADQSGGRPVWWLPTLEEAEEVLTRELGEGDLVVTLGAGDVDRLAERLVARLDGAAAEGGARVAAAGAEHG